MRLVSTAAAAWSWGMPAAVSPAMSPASITPIPPGTGAIPPSSEASVLTTMSVASEAEAP
jgi:hypothetical protein